MKIKQLSSLTLLSAALIGCAHQPPVPNPQVIIEKTTPSKIRNALVRTCDEMNMQIEQQNDSGVTCSRRATDAAQLFFGYKRGTDVMEKYQFTWFNLDKAEIKVSGSAWLESQNAYGMLNREPLPALKPQARGILFVAKGYAEGKK